MTPIHSGLTEEAAAARLREDGPNILPDADHRGLLRILWGVVREPMFALLLGGGAVYLVVGDLREALVLLAFAMISVAIAVVQEYRSERVLEALRDLVSPQATVLREGARRVLPSRGLVRGDLLVLSEGDRAQADAIFREGAQVEVDESLLTGEAVPVRKRTSALDGPAPAPGGEDTPYVYSGSLVVRGQGLAEITATGPRSEIGKIGGALRSIESGPGRLTTETRSIVRAMGALAILVCAAVVLLSGLGRGLWMQGLLGGIAVGMALLPEEFPLVLTVFMVMGANRISKARVLTRRASAIATLGSATVLCVDKTGTLTENRMALCRAWTAGAGFEWAPDGPPPRAVEWLVHLGALASSPHPFDPMEKAFHQSDATPIGDGWRIEQAHALSSECLAVTQVWTDGTDRIAAAKGALEAVLGLCGAPSDMAATVQKQAQLMAGQGIRVLGIASSRPGAGPLPDKPAGLGLQFVGLIGLADPLRADVPGAVAECRRAGVRVVMVTGDYPATARAIADQAGLGGEGVVTGAELRAMSDAELTAEVRSATVFARILPDQKLRIVQALGAAGEVVAMTGDGVNDAPALKAADIGIAMGKRGTEVARSAADLVLLEDDFASIVRAIALGRRIYDNLRKAMGFIVAVHVPIVGLALLPLAFGLPVFLAPAHIAFLEMIIDPVCSIVFEAEPAEGDVMDRPPRDPAARLFPAGMVAARAAQGIWCLAVVAVVYAVGRGWGLAEESVRALAFLALVLSVLGLVVANRSTGSIVKAFTRPNAAFGLTVAAVLGAVSAVLAAPGLRDLFHFGPIDLRGVCLAIAASAATLAGLEGIRRMVPNRT
jgi:Ca2+-transporting ATPase